MESPAYRGSFSACPSIPTRDRSTSTSGSASKIATSGARGCSTPRSCGPTGRCIYGAGCKGVLDGDATELAQGCCSYGAHFIDDDDVQTVLDGR